MIINDFNILTGEPIDPPVIIWEKNDRYAIIAFLLLFVDRNMYSDDLIKLNTFMGITNTEIKNDDNALNEKLANHHLSRDTIIREGVKFLENIDQDEDRYDCIMEEIDNVIYGNDKCKIGNGYAMLGKNSKSIKLPDAAYWLFEYVRLVDDILPEALLNTNTYSKNKKRLLKHLVYKWEIDKSILPILEASVETFEEIKRKHDEIQNSDISYREATNIISELNAKEKTVWQELNKLYIAKERSVSEYVTNTNAIADCIEALGGNPHRVRIKGEDEPEEDDDADVEETLTDKIGDRIVEGIQKVTAFICAPFDWLTDKLIDRM